MMYAEIRHLLHFHWRRSRRLLTVLAPLSVAITLLIYGVARLFVKTPEEWMFAGMLNLVLNGYAIAILAGFAGLWNKEGQMGRLTPGNYLMKLPIRIHAIAVSYFVFTCAVAASIAGIVMVLHLICFGGAVSPHGLCDHAAWPSGGAGASLVLWMFLFLCIVAAAAFQSGALVGGVQNEPIQFACGAGLFAVAIAGIAGASGIVHSPSGILRILGVIACMASFAVSYAISYKGIAEFRCQRSQRIFPDLVDRFRSGRMRTQPFASADAALRWYGWRKRCRLVLAGTLSALPFALIPVMVSFLQKHHLEIEPGYPQFVLVWFVVAFTGCFILTLANDYVAHLNGTPFLFMFPVASRRLARGLLFPLGGLFSIMIAAMIVVVVLMVRYVPVEHTAGPIAARDLIQAAAGGVLFGWIALWYVIPAFYVAVVVEIMILAGHHLLGMDALPLACRLVVAAVLLYGMSSLFIAQRNGCLQNTALKPMAALLVAALGCVACLAWLMPETQTYTTIHTPLTVPPSAVKEGSPGHLLLKLAALSALGMLAPLPVVDIATVMERFRHR